MLGKSVPRLAAAMALLVAAGLCEQVQAADPAAGKSVFGSVCSICHSAQPGKNGIGPSLFDVVSRKTGSVPGFHYSPANQNSNLTWDSATLDKYLQSPRTVIPGTIMTYAGLKDDTKRADLIAYLATLK
jgi:cytochrome c2